MTDILVRQQKRLLLISDAKNEADDQYALVHALLTPKFAIVGMVAVHFRAAGTNEQSFAEMEKLAELTKTVGQYPIVLGANGCLRSTKGGSLSAGAQLIIEEAQKQDERPLYLVCLGALTDVAQALVAQPAIQEKVVVVWVGGGRYPTGSPEANANNDLIAANLVLSSQAALWQIPSNAYKTLLVSVAELQIKVAPFGRLGQYLLAQLVAFANEFSNRKPWINSECWVFGDSAAIGVLLEEQKSYYTIQAAPNVTENGRYNYPGKPNRAIRVYHKVNERFILADLFAKIELFGRSEG